MVSRYECLSLRLELFPLLFPIHERVLVCAAAFFDRLVRDYPDWIPGAICICGDICNMRRSLATDFIAIYNNSR